MSAAPRFDRFLHRVHRRLVVVRMVESTARGALAASGPALILIGLLAWRGSESILSPAIACLAIGAVAGLIWGILHRPTTLETAMETDEQLRLADLFSSAIFALNHANDPWQRVLLAQAEGRCESVTPSMVLLRRLGVRTWGGLGLSIALIIVLSTMATTPSDTRAEAARSVATDDLADVSPTPSHPLVDLAPRGSQVASAAHPSAPAEAEDQQSRGSFPHDTPSKSNDAQPGDDRSDANHPSRPGEGTASGRTESPNHPAATPSPNPASNAPDSSNPTSPESGHDGGVGVGASAHPANPSDNGRSGTQIANSAAHPHAAAVPWRTDAWPSLVDQAGRQIDSGQIPAEYRDLVRAYFHRD